MSIREDEKVSQAEAGVQQMDLLLTWRFTELLFFPATKVYSPASLLKVSEMVMR